MFGLVRQDHPCSVFGLGTSKRGTMHLTCKIHMSASPFLLPCTKSSFKPHTASSHPTGACPRTLADAHPFPFTGTHTLLFLPPHQHPSLVPLPHPHSSSARAHQRTCGVSRWSSPACGSACTSFPVPLTLGHSLGWRLSHACACQCQSRSSNQRDRLNPHLRNIPLRG